MKKTLTLMALVMMTVSCVNMDYVGKQYTPTNEVEMYFDTYDIKREFEVMGILTAESGEFISTETIQEKVMEKAREKGADAVLFESFDKKLSGSTTETREHKFGISTSTSTTEEKVVKVKFLKFK